MTTYAVTGTTGHLGRLAVGALLARGVPAAQVVALARRPEAAQDLGVDVRRADYDDPATLTSALAGVDRLLLVSGSQVGQRARQHAAVVVAAQEAGVELVAYTSILRADTSSLLLAEEHRETERLLADSGLPHVLLRNGWYTENWTEQLGVHLAHGVAGAAGEGRVSAATRADYAEAAVAALVDGTPGRVHELGGPAFTLAELAAVETEVTGTPVAYADLPQEQYEQVLLGAGLPAPVARVLADADRGLAAGDLHTGSTDLADLLGRPATPLRDAVAAAWRQVAQA